MGWARRAIVCELAFAQDLDVLIDTAAADQLPAPIGDAGGPLVVRTDALELAPLLASARATGRSAAVILGPVAVVSAHSTAEDVLVARCAIPACEGGDDALYVLVGPTAMALAARLQLHGLVTVVRNVAFPDHATTGAAREGSLGDPSSAESRLDSAHD